MFTGRMSEEENRENLRKNDQRLKEIQAMAGEYDMLILDEALYAVGLHQLSEEPLLWYLKHKPAGLEVVLTGRSPSAAMIACADYCSCIHKEKHPFDQGLSARPGIEY